MLREPLNIDVLLDRLDQTVRWCGPRADPADAAGCLRTLGWCRDPFVDRRTLVYWVAQDRARRLNESAATYDTTWGKAPRHRTEMWVNLRRGRILAFLPDINLYHGMEASECGGYIDENNNPPCDTWLAYTDGLDGEFAVRGGCLLSWVPPVFVGPVQAAMDVCPESCLLWFDEMECRLAGEMRVLMEKVPRLGS